MIAQVIETKQLSADGYQWNQHSPRVATITNDLLYFSQVAYFAFDSWDEAHNFLKYITDRQHCTRAQVRKSERFTSHLWEVKTWGMPQSMLEKLIERDRNRKPQALPVPPIRRDWSLSESYSAITYEAA